MVRVNGRWFGIASIASDPSLDSGKGGETAGVVALVARQRRPRTRPIARRCDQAWRSPADRSATDSRAPVHASVPARPYGALHARQNCRHFLGANSKSGAAINPDGS